jgi:hypothetical protein
MAADSVEPWLRGPLPGVHPVLAPTIHAYMQVREDLDRWTEGLSDTQVWSRPHGLAPVGFQLKHIAGSVERLTTYLRGDQLTDGQLAAARTEFDPGLPLVELLGSAHRSLDDSELVIRSIDPKTLSDARAVGRKGLPTTVAGLVVHLAEHTQRHVGELIISSKLARVL